MLVGGQTAQVGKPPDSKASRIHAFAYFPQAECLIFLVADPLQGVACGLKIGLRSTARKAVIRGSVSTLVSILCLG